LTEGRASAVLRLGGLYGREETPARFFVHGLLLPLFSAQKFISSRREYRFQEKKSL
jgi:hypothetical protein